MADSTLTTIMVGLLDENPANPRKTFDDGKLAELAESIKSVGLLQPIVVRPTRKRYEIVCGHRRVRAAKLAGVFEVPAIVRKLTDREAGYAALVENGQRADVAPLELLVESKLDGPDEGRPSPVEAMHQAIDAAQAQG